MEIRSASLASFLRRLRTAVRSGHFRVTGYAREGAEALDWDDWDIAEQLSELAAADWLRSEESTAQRGDIVWVFTPSYWDGGFLWVRLVERDGVVVVSLHRG